MVSFNHGGLIYLLNSSKAHLQELSQRKGTVRPVRRLLASGYSVPMPKTTSPEGLKESPKREGLEIEWGHLPMEELCGDQIETSK